MISVGVLSNMFSRRAICLLLALSIFFSPIALLATESQAHQRSKFSQAVDKGFAQVAQELDRVILLLCKQLNKNKNISVKVGGHFYDARIRRYFVSVSGNCTINGKAPYKIKADSYLISGDQEVSFDLSINDIRQSADALSFAYSGTVVFSMERIAYEMIEGIPHIAASGALSPALNMLREFLKGLNVAILSDAISKTIGDFSKVAIAKTATELLSAAGSNRPLKKVIKDSVKSGSIISFLGLQIIRCAATSLASVTGASLGAAVGSIVAPGIGSVIGGYLGSRIFSIAAKVIVYQTTRAIPFKINLKRMLFAHQILQKNSGDQAAMRRYTESMNRIFEMIKKELNSEKFRLFKSLMQEIDELHSSERIAAVPLLKKLQTILSFKITNEGDWYYARKYYLMKEYVERWKLEKEVIF